LVSQGVKYVGHLVSATGTSFTPEKPLKVLSSTHDSKGDAPIHRPHELLPISCSAHDRYGETLERHDTSRQIPEYWQAHLDNRKLCSVQALPTSYIELSVTLRPRGHCHTYPPN
jgi:hypothetical protein